MEFIASQFNSLVNFPFSKEFSLVHEHILGPTKTVTLKYLPECRNVSPTYSSDERGPNPQSDHLQHTFPYLGLGYE